MAIISESMILIELPIQKKNTQKLDKVQMTESESSIYELRATENNKNKTYFQFIY